MFILRAIGLFFVRIGRWIKNTAWVQPLLIVGGIFAIIFSIPAISSWVSSWFSGYNEANAFYNNYKVSLSDAQNKNSDANKLFTYMEARAKGEATEADKKKWGEKFYVVFVQEDCSGCETIYKGFDVLKSEWGTNTFATPEGKTATDFKMYTIYVDTEETINNETKNLFKDYFYNTYDASFEEISGVMQESYYCKHVGSSYESDLETIHDADKFATPTIFLFDPDYKLNTTQLGVSEVLFTVSGKKGQSGSYPIAYTLFDCWWHLDIFSADYTE